MNKKHITTTATADISRGYEDIRSAMLELEENSAIAEKIDARNAEILPLLYQYADTNGTVIGHTDKSVFTAIRFLIGKAWHFFVKVTTTKKGTIDHAKAEKALAEKCGMTETELKTFLETFRKPDTVAVSYRLHLTQDERKAFGIDDE